MCKANPCQQIERPFIKIHKNLASWLSYYNVITMLPREVQYEEFKRYPGISGIRQP